MFPLAARFTSEDATWDRVRDFFAALFDSRIDSVDLVVWGAVLLGVTCGMLGCFIVLRRQSLLGDAIGHSVLPGVCLGFMAAGTRSVTALMLGALVAGLAAAGLIALLQRTTWLKAGECMGVVFTGFFGLGIVLLKYIQNGGNIFAWIGLGRGEQTGQSGLETFLFGQIAAITGLDVVYMAIVAMAAIGIVFFFWRALAVSSFDESFAFSIGIPVRAVHYLLMGLVTVAIVISIQAVGVVLVAAMLITPAATAYLLTDRLHWMVILAALFGAAAGVAGAFVSWLGDDIPTGAFMVLGAAMLFGLAFFLSPRQGVLPRVIRLWQKRQRTGAENLLRTLYIMAEQREGAPGEPRAIELSGNERRFTVDDVAAHRQETAAHVRRTARRAAKRGWLGANGGDELALTDTGVEEARRIVRNHRLWELFLTQEANLAPDHVHADAEYIEHMLPRDVLQRLEQMLDHPAADPHGSPIP